MTRGSISGIRLPVNIPDSVAIGAAVVIHRHTYMKPCGLGFDRPVCAVRDPWQRFTV
jgi:hypothetical protein